MIKRIVVQIFILVFVLAFCGEAVAQESRLYLSVVSTKLFVVGASNPRTGAFYQHPSQDTVWAHIGPVNIRAFAVAVHPGTSYNVAYIAAGNGVHKTTDGGQTWKVTTGWEITEVLWVSPDPHDVQTVYIATPYGVYKTTDGCSTWKQINSGLKATFTSCVLVDQVRAGRVYCATEDGAYASKDGGTSWQRLGLSVGGVRVLTQHPHNPEILFAGTEDHGVYMTSNGGRWWSRCEAGIDHTTFYTIAFAPGEPSIMYAGGYVTGVYKSTDGGGSWNRVNNGLSTLTVHSIAVDPLDSSRVYAGTHNGGVFRTDDGGASWRFVGMPESQVWTVQFAKQ